MSITDRNTLKGYFKNGLIPNEEHFSSLIDSGINTLEDGIEKEAGQPLKIQASTLQEDLIHFYRLLSDPIPTWRINQMPSATVEGLSVVDSTSNVRLFIDKLTGRVGLGTTAPEDSLHVGNGKIRIGPPTGTLPAWMNYENTSGTLIIGGSDQAFFGLRNRGGATGGSNDFDTLLYWGDDVNDHLVVENARGEALRITGEGKIGIGTQTPNPSFNLSVQGGAMMDTLRLETASGEVGLTLNAAGIAHQHWVSGVGNMGYYLYNDADQARHLILQRGTGNLGLGVVDPQEKLHLSSGKIMVGSNLGNHSSWIDYSNTQGLYISSGSDNAFFGMKNRGGVAGDSNSFDAVVYWGDDLDDDLIFGHVSGERMRITGDGNIGMGIADPLERLHLASGKIVMGADGVQTHTWLHHANTQGLYITSGSDNAFFGMKNRGGAAGGTNDFDAVVYWGDDLEDDFVFEHRTGERMRVTGDGNIGVGIANPLERLHLASGKILLGTAGVLANSWLDYANTQGLYLSSGSDSAFFGMKNRGGATGGENDFDTVVYWGDDSTDNLVFENYGGERMKILGGGNVGIGMATPTEKLHIDSGVIKIGPDGGHFSAYHSHANTQGLFVQSGSDNAFFGMKNRGGAAGSSNDFDAVVYWGDDTADDLIFENYYGERMRVTGDGNVGIGTNNPLGKLDVRGNILAGNSDLYFTKTDHNHTGFGNTMGYAAIENTANHNCLMILGRQTTSGRRVKMWDHVTVHGVFVNASDARLKENVEDLAYGLEAILALRPVSYSRKDLPNNDTHIGLIAQEVAPVIDELVSEETETEENTLSVNYIGLVPVLINAVKELKAELDQLKKQMAS